MTDRALAGSFSGEGKFRDVLLIFAIGLLINCHRLGEGPLAGTEGHRALVAHQMVQQGHWLLPRLYDQLYLAKPPLDYWILGGLEKLTGQATPFIWRLPSAVAAAMMAAFLCFITARWYGRLAGLIAGLASCSLIALWAQNHTAEIDSLNTFASVAAACLLLDMSFGPARTKNGIMIAAALACGAAFLLKGPTSLIPILAAVIGPILFNRRMGGFNRPWPWISIALGLAIFAAYALAAMGAFKALHVEPDTSGINEISANIFNPNRLPELPQNLLLPLTMLMYMMPATLCLPLALRREAWSNSAPSPRWSNSDRELLRGLVGALTVACAITMLCGMVHPRYSYVWIPLICPLAGAVIAAWQRGLYSEKTTEYIYISLAITAILFGGATIAIAILCALWHGGHAISLWIFAAISIALVALILDWIDRKHVVMAGWATVCVIILAGQPFGIESVVDRNRRSTFAGSQLLRSILPEGSTITTGHEILDHPEVFYYAHLKVESHPNTLVYPQPFPTNRWVLMDVPEYTAWQRKYPERLSSVRPIQYRGASAILVYYRATTTANTRP